ncbi:ankyrin repeat protein [Bordetella bronchiseptica OSU553]|nr:ankyrin repeat protein [Bordetella bronchiseptica OSU553]
MKPLRTHFLRWRDAAAGGLLAGALLASPAWAAKQADWWVYVHNDKARDISALLAAGADPNVRYDNGQPAIMRAVVDNAWEVFDVLAANRRTDLNAENPAGETPLMYLAVAGQTERAQALIARGAQVNRLGWTPLHYAASKGRLETARMLLGKQALVNAPSPDGTTPLMMAAYSGDRRMVQLLLDAGGDITTRNLKGMSAADWAAFGKSEALARELKPMIARAEAERQARHGAVATPKLAPAAETPPTAQPAAAPAAASQPGEGRSLSGVSGVRLNSYD